MNLSDIKLIATDIDGTMLRSDHSLSERVRNSLCAAQEAGIQVVPTTGRPFAIAGDVMETLTCPEFWILANGAVTYSAREDRIVRGFWMAVPVAQQVVTKLRAAVPDIQFAVELERSSVFEDSFRQTLSLDPESYGSVPVDDVTEHLDGRIQKLLAFQPARNLDELYQAISAAVGDLAVASYSGMNFVELSASLVTKAHALDALVGDLGMTKANVAAFGDNHNDIPMLEWAGHSYAMGNATEDAKEAAGAIIGQNDKDGLADHVDEIVTQATSL